MAKGSTPKADLRTPRNGKPAISGLLHTWLMHHPDALALIDEWLALRAIGETMWSMKDVLAELKLSHDMPPFGDSGLRGWLERNRTELYRQGLPR